MTMTLRPPRRLRQAAPSRVWTWEPQLYWFGLPTLSPVTFGHDEYSRRTIVIGWPFSGRLIVAYRWCGSTQCFRESVRMLEAESGVSHEC